MNPAQLLDLVGSRLLIGLFFMAIFLPCHAQVSEGERGGVALVEAGESIESLVFNGKQQLIWDGKAIVGIPLDVTPGTIGALATDTLGNKIQQLILVRDKRYPEERIYLDDENMVTPPKLDLERINRESALMREVYDRFSPQPVDLAPVIQPAQGRVSGVFGSRRFFNDQPRNPHSGIDYAAPIGTPIRMPTHGTIALTGDFYFNGKTVMIDHGGGFISMMCHLSKILVKEGQNLQRGDTVGHIGATGRATGPHLHWSVSLAGSRVDPSSFMAIVNSSSTSE